MLRFQAIILIFLWCSVVMAGGINECTKEEAIQAESESSRLTTWKDVYQSFQRFSHCDDGAIAEGYNHSIAKILGSKSPKIEELHTFTRVNVEFENFIIRHVSGAVPTDDLEKIKFNLSQNCPPKSRMLCDKLMIAASEAK